jgi:transcriptional regulator with XRE-family HTH domain
MKTTVQFVTTSEMMLAMQIHELLGAGIRAARLKKGWRQQDAAARFQMYGLPTWKPVAVGQVETGVRKPSIGELLLACAALEVSVADLIPDVDEPVDLGAGATMSAAAVRALLSGRWEDFPRNPDDFAFPGETWLEGVLQQAGAVRDRQRALIQPILDRSDLDPWSEDVHRVFLPPTDAEAHAARRLEVEPVQVKAAALALWHRGFEAERDARMGEAGDAPSARTLAARRGHATRAMLAELREFLDTTAGEKG